MQTRTPKLIIRGTGTVSKPTPIGVLLYELCNLAGLQGEQRHPMKQRLLRIVLEHLAKDKPIPELRRSCVDAIQGELGLIHPTYRQSIKQSLAKYLQEVERNGDRQF